MRLFLFIAAAITGYAVSSLNPAIILSRAIYRKDIRECGSGNPGFTNFKRTFGGKWAWWVFLLDLLKAAAMIALFAWLLSRQGVDRQLGAVYTGFFCMLGHAYPPLYGFKGGKGFLVCLSTFLLTDFRVGLIAAGVMCLLLLTTKYMSLSTVTAILLSPILMIPFGASLPVILISAACALFMAFRHRENIRRLLGGRESRFYLFGRSDKQP